MDALEFTMAWQITASYPALEWESTDTLEGEGTADDPYVVTDVYELQNVADEPEAHYVLGNDIDATETELWTGGAGFEPIGSEEEPFEGRSTETARRSADWPSIETRASESACSGRRISTR